MLKLHVTRSYNPDFCVAISDEFQNASTCRLDTPDQATQDVALHPNPDRPARWALEFAALPSFTIFWHSGTAALGRAVAPRKERPTANVILEIHISAPNFQTSLTPNNHRSHSIVSRTCADSVTACYWSHLADSLRVVASLFALIAFQHETSRHGTHPGAD